MRRIVPLSVVIAAALPAAAIAANRSHPYTVKEVRKAFGSSGISLRAQHVRASAPYARFTTSFPLRVIVFRNVAAATRKIEVVLGSGPPKTCRRCIVIRFAAPRGSQKPAIQETQVGNVAVAYVKSKHLGPRVQGALHELRHLHRS
jgi:hypothetical protein